MREGDNRTQLENRRGVVRLKGHGGARKGRRERAQKMGAISVISWDLQHIRYPWWLSLLVYSPYCKRVYFFPRLFIISYSELTKRCREMTGNKGIADNTGWSINSRGTWRKPDHLEETYADTVRTLWINQQPNHQGITPGHGGARGFWTTTVY